MQPHPDFKYITALLENYSRSIEEIYRSYAAHIKYMVRQPFF